MEVGSNQAKLMDRQMMDDRIVSLRSGHLGLGFATDLPLVRTFRCTNSASRTSRDV